MLERDLLFIGGGHTHALAIRSLAMRPLKNVRITLISEQTLTPYSGMLPGYVAGHYTHADAHIDLNRLCQWANVRWIKGQVRCIDAAAKTATVVLPESGSELTVAGDVLSIDIGSTPDRSVSGAAQYAVGVKPVSQFAATWNKLLLDSAQSNEAQWGVIGAGAGGVELVLGMAHRLPQLHYHLVFPGDHVLPGYPNKLIKTVEHRLQAVGVQLHSNFRVTEVTADGLSSEDGQLLKLAKSIWCTGASAANWLRESDLKTSECGFVAVNEFLQSVSHPHVFAVGDCADMLHDPRPKAGVYAVRQAPYLVDNLRGWFNRSSMRAVRLQSDFLSLISLGDQSAVGCRAGFVASGSWVWKLKDHIDTKFMRQLNEPGPKLQMADPVATDQMHCAGCGSKLGPALLEGNLSLLPVHNNSAVIPALGNAEDASLWQVSQGMSAVQSIDGFRSFTTDLWRFGKICVNHALSDIYAMGATPVSAQVWINLTFAHPRLQKRDHLLLMSGIADALAEQQTTLAGGHSTEGMENHVAIVANGEIDPDQLWHKNTPGAGDVLVLTKALGTGVILAADMQALAPATAVEAAYQSMSLANREDAKQLTGYRVSAVTDVTGFGLIGHLLEMMDGQSLGAALTLDRIPFIDGVRELARNQIRSTLYPQLQPLLLECDYNNEVDQHLIDLLIDPQTSGGLLVAMDSIDAAHYVAGNQGDASVIGEVIESERSVVIV